MNEDGQLIIERSVAMEQVLVDNDKVTLSRKVSLGLAAQVIGSRVADRTIDLNLRLCEFALLMGAVQMQQDQGDRVLTTHYIDEEDL